MKIEKGFFNTYKEEYVHICLTAFAPTRCLGWPNFHKRKTLWQFHHVDVIDSPLWLNLFAQPVLLCFSHNTAVCTASWIGMKSLDVDMDDTSTLSKHLEWIRLLDLLDSLSEKVLFMLTSPVIWPLRVVMCVERLSSVMPRTSRHKTLQLWFEIAGIIYDMSANRHDSRVFRRREDA